MREQLAVVLTVARDATLARIEIAYFGFNMAEYATWMAILVYAYGIGGAGTAALFALIQLIPSGLVAPIAAALGDRFRRDRVLLGGYLWQAISMLATAIVLYANPPALVVLIVATIASTSFTITRPVQSVILPSVTHTPADLTASNAVSGLAENIGIFVGPLLGGLLLTRSEPGDVFAAFGLITLVGAALVARLEGDEVRRTPEHDDVEGVGATLAATFSGFRGLTAAPEALLIVALLGVATIVIGALDILFVATAIDLLGVSESWAGFLYSAFGLGGVLGAVATVALVGRRRMTPTLAGSSGLFGVPISAVGLVPSTLSAPLLLGAAGAGYSVATVAARTLLQRVAPEALLARLFGVLEGLNMFALAIGSVVTGLLVETLGVAAALVVDGLLVPVLLIVVWARLSAVDRNARPPDTVALALLRRLDIFGPLSAPSIERILAELTWLDLPASHVMIREGEPGDRFYILGEGRVVVTVRGKAVAERGVGDHFGEIALLRNVPRTATVTTLTPVRVIAIERDRFLEAVTGHPQSRARAEKVADERRATTTDQALAAPTADAQRPGAAKGGE